MAQSVCTRHIYPVSHHPCFTGCCMVNSLLNQMSLVPVPDANLLFNSKHSCYSFYFELTHRSLLACIKISLFFNLNVLFKKNKTTDFMSFCEAEKKSERKAFFCRFKQKYPPTKKKKFWHVLILRTSFALSSTCCTPPFYDEAFGSR